MQIFVRLVFSKKIKVEFVIVDLSLLELFWLQLRLCLLGFRGKNDLM